MKTLIYGGLAMLMMLSNPNPALASAGDEAKIQNIVQSVATLADTHQFEALEKLFAPEVRVDYTSAFGGEAELKSPQALMTAWAGLLPGFDATRHAVSNIKSEIKGTKASATADVVTDHYIAGKHWKISGSYDYQLINNDGEWLITGVTFNAGEEKGSRDVLGLATETAKADPPAYIKRQQTKQVVRDFLTSLEEKDMQKFANVWAEDAVQDMPYSPEGFPKRVEGKANLIKHYSAWPEISGDANFTKNLVMHGMQDPELVYVEYKGVVDVVPTKRTYKQTYGGLFHVENGKIKLFREYYDPAAFAYAFDLAGSNSFGNQK